MKISRVDESYAHKQCKLGNVNDLKRTLAMIECYYDIRQSDYQYLLIAAIKAGQYKVVDYLCRRGADINYRSSWHLMHILFLHSGNINFIDVMKTLRTVVDHGINLSVRDHMGRSILYPALKYGNDIKCIRYLVNCGVKYTDQDFMGQTITSMVSKRYPKCLEKVKYFVEECKYDVNEKAFNGITPLFNAYVNVDLVKYYVSHGADLFHYNDEGYRALDVYFTNIMKENNIALYVDSYLYLKEEEHVFLRKLRANVIMYLIKNKLWIHELCDPWLIPWLSDFIGFINK